jgi:2-hydroxy-6-oxonona-2,4-dienedioate hydrolase
MNGLQQQTLDIAGGKTRILRGGKPGAPATLFLHGGIPGVTPYCGGAHIWGDCLAAFLPDRNVIAPDLPGSGGTVQKSQPLTMDTLGQHVVEMLSALSLDTVDVVGHDLGGLIGVWMALSHPARVRSLSIVASPMCPPTADGLDTILLASPPQPPWNRDSQAWALERLSHVHTHIDGPLLDRCVTASLGEAHRKSVEDMKSHYAGMFAPSMNRVRYRLWDACRNNGLQVPTQIVWASHDPATSREQGMVLFDAIAGRQKALQMHVINRSGSFPFREQAAAFHHIVGSFQDGVLKERCAA